MPNFHTHANLSQALNTILLQHYNDLNKKEGEPLPSLPSFVLEALHQISFNLADLMNNDFADANTWKRISAYAELTANIICEQKQPIPFNNNKEN